MNMKKKIFLISLGIAFVILGVLNFLISIKPKGLSNEQIIAETAKCRKAGLNTYEVIHVWTYDITKIVCTKEK